MSCARLDEVLSPTPSAEALTHAKTCEECGPARAAWNALGRSTPAPATAALEEARLAALQELKEHPKARAWWTDALALVAVNLGVTAGVSSLLTWSLTQHSSPVMRWSVAGALVAIIVLGAWGAVRPGAQGLRIATVALVVMVAMWASLGSSGFAPEAPFISGLGCTRLELMMAIIPLPVALWATSRFARDSLRSLAAGASVGATGMLVLHLYCPNGTFEHLLLFHLLPWALVALLAVGIRRRVPTHSYAP